MAVAGRHLHGGRARRGRLPVRYPAVCHRCIYSTRRPAIFRPTGLSGPAPHLGYCRGPPSRHLAAPAPAGSLDSTRATQTPRCGGSRAGVVCHRRAPRFDQPRGCSRAVQPLESRRGDLPTPRLSTLFSLAVNLSRYQPSPQAPRRRPYRRRGRAPSSVVRAGRAAGPTQPAASEHFPADPRQRAGQLRARHGSSGWDVGLHNPALSTVA